MKTMAHFWFLASLLAVGVIGLIALDPEPTGCAVRPGTVAERLATREELERQRIVALNHAEARIRVARCVIAKELTVLQGAEQLFDLHQVNPYFDWGQFRTVYAGESDLERCQQQLQDTIRNELGTKSTMDARNRSPASMPASVSPTR
jgi:hypothetical protein